MYSIHVIRMPSRGRAARRRVGALLGLLIFVPRIRFFGIIIINITYYNAIIYKNEERRHSTCACVYNIIESAARISDTFRRAKEEHGFHRYIYYNSWYMRVRAGKTTRRKKSTHKLFYACRPRVSSHCPFKTSSR